MQHLLVHHEGLAINVLAMKAAMTMVVLWEEVVALSIYALAMVVLATNTMPMYTMLVNPLSMGCVPASSPSSGIPQTLHRLLN